MATSRNTARLQVGSAAWVADERDSASKLIEAEVEEFTFSARNELEWLNEHMREIFDENQLSVAEMFKTPGKLRGKTPRTIRRNPVEMRAPLTDIFSASPRNAASTPQAKVFRERATPNFEIAKDVASSPAPQSVKAASISPEKAASPTRKPVPNRAPPPSFQDSGYHSQSQSQQATQEATQRYSQSVSPERASSEAQQQSVEDNHTEDERPRTADTVETAETHQTDEEEVLAQLQAEASMIHQSPQKTPAHERSQHMSSPVIWTPGTAHTLKHVSPEKSSPFHSSPHKSFHEPMVVDEEHEEASQSEKKHAEVFDEAGTPSDGSSPVRQVIRKSSLSFASLPQREPLTVKKSIGQRTSRGSHFEASRSSYFGNVGDKKSFGGNRAQEVQDDHDEMDLDDAESSVKRSSKTYTQRLQDQINLLGQVKTTQSRLSKSTTNLAAASTNQPTYPTLPQEEEHIPSSPMRTVRSERSFAAPGAYPEEDSWIGGPPPATASIPFNKALSPRQHLVKSYSVDVMEDLRGNGGSIGGREFNVPQREPRQPSTMVEKPISAVPERARTLGHLKSQSTTSFHSPQRKEEIRGFETLKKTISVENPHRDGHDKDYHYSPSKSPAHSLRGSPLKAAKDKLSSILKTSKGLFASSAAVIADAKMAAAGSPIGSSNVSQEEQALRNAQNEDRPTMSLYPALSNPFENQSRIPDSPSKKNSIRKLKEKEAKEARVMAEQLTKLDRERTKEAEKARVHSQQERERVASMERKVAAQREQQRQDEERRAAIAREEERRESERREAHRLEEERALAEEEEQRRIAAEREAERKAASTPSLPRPTRSSPRKTKAQLEAEGRAAAAKRADEMDIDNADAQMMPPPSTIGRSQIARPKSAAATRLQRPTSKQAAPAARGAPVVIRVNTGSRPFQPSTAALSASLGDSLPPAPAPAPNPIPPPSRGGRPATKAIVPKASNESLKGAANSKVRALESAARKREQEEREAREKREAKVAMAQQLEAKRNAQKAEERKREIERAKERRPPPPPARPNPHADREKPLPAPPANQRINQELQRPLQDRNESYQSTKAPPKRPLGGEENQRPGMPRNGPSYQQQSEAKRRKTEDEYDFDMPSPPRGAAAPPIRQSSIRKQDAPMKSLFPSGYAAAQGHEGIRNVPNAIPQHMQQKPTRPMENKAQPPQGFSTNASHKTPARMGSGAPNGKSTSKRSAKNSPAYLNGENIDLPEINTDSDDSDSDADNKNFSVPEWANSPNLAAGIIAQEGRDPMTVFGPPAELKMEEVFKNKERWGRFRQRTSSANWSGQDRLTEEEVRRDLEVRERLRREGGWSYGMGQ